MNLYNLLTCILDLLYPNNCLGCPELLKAEKLALQLLLMYKKEGCKTAFFSKV